MLISSEKYIKKKGKKYMNSTVMYCSLTNKPYIPKQQDALKKARKEKLYSGWFICGRISHLKDNYGYVQNQGK